MKSQMFIGASLAALAVSSPALAQSVEQTGAAQVSEDGGIGDIVVTAQRREQSTQKTALSITAFGGDEMRAAGISDADSLAKLSPGLQISGGTNNMIYIRGVGDFGVTATASPGVATNLDGVVIARPPAVSGNFYDLERVELLKGPQGTLYGRNASGGALNLITVAPVLGEFSGYAEANVGNYDQYGIEGAFNVPGGDNGAFRLSYSLNRRNGYLTNGGDDDDREAFRFQARFEAGPLSLRTQFNYLHRGGIGSGLTVVGGLPGQSPWVGNTVPQAGAAYLAAITAQFNAALAGGCNPAPAPVGNCPPPPELIANPADSKLFQDIESYGAHFQLDYDLGGAVLTLIPAYRRTHSRFAVQPSFTYSPGGVYDAAGDRTDGDKSDQYSVEMRVGGESDLLKWVLGGYYFKENITNDYALLGGPILNLRMIGSLGTETLAGFGQATFSLSDRFRVTGGARYTTDKRTSGGLANFAISPSILTPDPVNSGLPPLPCLPDVPGPGANPPGTLCRLLNADPSFYASQKRFNKFTWKAGIEFDVGPSSMFYADVSTGFKAGGFNQALDLTNPNRLQPFDPESITAYSIGLKSRFLDNKLQVNLEGFYWDYTNLQLSAQGVDAAGLNSILTQNAGKSTIKGASVSVEARPWRGGTLRGAVEYVDSKYDEFLIVQPAQFAPPGRTGCVQTYSGGLATIDCSGFPLVRSPKWSGNAGFTQEFDLTNGGTVALSGDMAFSSSYYFLTEFTAQEKQGAYATFSATLTYTAPGDKWHIGAFVRNITNEAVYNGGNGQSSFFAQGWVSTSIAPPRTWGVRAGVKF